MWAPRLEVPERSFLKRVCSLDRSPKFKIALWSTSSCNVMGLWWIRVSTCACKHRLWELIPCKITERKNPVLSTTCLSTRYAQRHDTKTSNATTHQSGCELTWNLCVVKALFVKNMPEQGRRFSTAWRKTQPARWLIFRPGEAHLWRGANLKGLPVGINICWTFSSQYTSLSYTYAEGQSYQGQLYDEAQHSLVQTLLRDHLGTNDRIYKVCCTGRKPRRYKGAASDATARVCRAQRLP